MKAVLFDEHGGVDKLVYRECPDPVARATDVIVRVRAAGLNYLDIFARRGMPNVTVPLPFISGGDIAGEVESLGDLVAGWRAGDTGASGTSIFADCRPTLRRPRGG